MFSLINSFFTRSRDVSKAVDQSASLGDDCEFHSAKILRDIVAEEAVPIKAAITAASVSAQERAANVRLYKKYDRNLQSYFESSKDTNKDQAFKLTAENECLKTRNEMLSQENVILRRADRSPMNPAAVTKVEEHIRDNETLIKCNEARIKQNLRSIDPSVASKPVIHEELASVSSMNSLEESEAELLSIINNIDKDGRQLFLTLQLHNAHLQGILAKKNVPQNIRNLAARKVIENRQGIVAKDKERLALQLARQLIRSPRLGGSSWKWEKVPMPYGPKGSITQETENQVYLDAEKRLKQQIATCKEQHRYCTNMLDGTGAYAGREMYEIYGDFVLMQENQALAQTNEELVRENTCSRSIIHDATKKLDQGKKPPSGPSYNDIRNEHSRKYIKNTKDIASNNIEIARNRGRILERELARGAITEEAFRQALNPMQQTWGRCEIAVKKCEGMLQKNNSPMYISYRAVRSLPLS